MAIFFPNWYSLTFPLSVHALEKQNDHVAGTNAKLILNFWFGENWPVCIIVLLQVLLLMKNLTVNLSSPEFEPIVSSKINSIMFI